MGQPSERSWAGMPVSASADKSNLATELGRN
jgi:hypothetical protein